jgi:hypothetical protein
MFRKHGRGLLDFLVSVLCLWVAAYHTPAGALARRFGAWALDVKSSARPLLSYYEGGADDLYMPAVPLQLPPQLAQMHGTVPDGSALGYGAYIAWMQLPAAERAPMRDLALRYGADPARLEDPDKGPPELVKVFKAAKEELGTDEAAMLAVMCGYEPARYARDRARAEGGPVELGLLVRQLPPEFESRAVHAATGPRIRCPGRSPRARPSPPASGCASTPSSASTRCTPAWTSRSPWAPRCTRWRRGRCGARARTR